MKRLSIIAAAAAISVLQTSCGSPTTGNTSPGSPAGSQPPASVSDVPANNDVRVGLGFVSTTSESTSASTETAGNAKFNAVACAVCVDANGKILDIKFDTLQSSVGFDVSGALTGDLASEIKTKKEIGDAYGMKAASGIKKEWYEQIAALEDWMRGKTVDDVLAMKVTDTEQRKTPDEADLKTSVTISVTDQLHALEKAYANAK